MYLGGLITYPDINLDYESLHVTFSLMCLTFGRDDLDTHSPTTPGASLHTPTMHHILLTSKRLHDLNAIDAAENASTCTGTTMGGELNK